jgi:hypothetical protein
MHPLCYLDAFCRRCDSFGHHVIYCDAVANPAMPIGGFIKARCLHRRRTPTRADPVALACTHRSPVTSNNLYDVLDLDMDEEHTGDDDLDGSPVDAVILPTLDGTATLALDTLHTNGCTTVALTNTDIFDGSPHRAYLDSANQLPAVLQSPACLDELEVTTGHLNGAVPGSQMTITHTGIMCLAPGIDLPAVVCPEAAANLIGMMPMLNTCPTLTLTIEAAVAGAHVCIRE